MGLEVTAEPGGGSGIRSWFLRIGTDVPFTSTANRPAIDLAVAPILADCYGRIQLTCRPLASFDGKPLSLRFVRLPAIRMEYIDDPKQPSSATAVRLRADFRAAGIEAGPDTEVILDPGEPQMVVLRSACSELSPGVTASLPGGRGEVRVRISVSRGTFAKPAGGFDGWKALPVQGLDLEAVGRDDRLLLEFHRPPPTEMGRLVTRVRDGWELFVGISAGMNSRANVFQIDLHRWRDGFGTGAIGPIQVRSASGWIDVAVLSRAVTPPEEPPQPPRETWWQRWIADLNRAVTQDDKATARELVHRYVDRGSWESTSVVAADLLPLAIAGAALAVLMDPADLQRARDALAPLITRPDLSEARLLDHTLAIRLRPLSGAEGTWSSDRLEAIQTSLHDVPQSDVLLAECYYNFARTSDGSAAGCWDSCLALSEQFLRAPGRKTGLAVSDATLLWEFARLMQRRLSVTREPSLAELLPSHAPWVKAARFANRYLREPWPRPRPAPEIPALPEAAPTVLLVDDVALLRFIVAQAKGAEDAEKSWPVVQRREDKQFPFAGLLRARRALYAGDPAAARAEYDRLLTHAQADDPGELLDIIAEERPLG